MTSFLAGENLTADDLNTFVNPPLLLAEQTVVQLLTTGIWAAITMTSETIDTINGHSTSVNTARYTPNVAGNYDCEGQVAFAANITGDRGAQFRKNGSVVAGLKYGAQRAMAGTGSFAGIARCGGVVFLNGTTDYVELYGYQDCGGNLDTYYNASFTGSYMKITRIGS